MDRLDISQFSVGKRGGVGETEGSIHEERILEPFFEVGVVVDAVVVFDICEE